MVRAGGVLGGCVYDLFTLFGLHGFGFGSFLAVARLKVTWRNELYFY